MSLADLTQAVFFSPRWLNPKYDKKMYEAAKIWVSQVNQIARDLGTHDDFLYHNFAGGFQDPLTSYGADSVRFMRSVAEKYDHEGFFQTQMPGGFKLGREKVITPGLYVQS